MWFSPAGTFCTHHFLNFNHRSISKIIKDTKTAAIATYLKFVDVSACNTILYVAKTNTRTTMHLATAKNDFMSVSFLLLTNGASAQGCSGATADRKPTAADCSTASIFNQSSLFNPRRLTCSECEL